MSTSNRTRRKNYKTNNPKRIEMREILLDKLESITKPHKLPKTIDITKGFDFINQIKLTHLLDVELNSYFKCKISNHKSENAYCARIVRYKGKEYYHCKFCNSEKYMSVSDALCGLLYLNPLKMQLSVFEKLGIEVTSTHKEKSNKVIDDNLIVVEQALKSRKFPSLEKGNLLNLYVEILRYTKEKMLINAIIQDEIIISIPLSVLSQHLQTCGYTGVDKGTLSRKTNLLTLLGLIRKEHSNRLPEYIRKENKIRQSKSRQNKYYDKTYWNIPVLTVNHLEEAETLLNFLKTQHITLKNLTAAKLKFLLGKERAAELFPAKKFYNAGYDDDLVGLIVEGLLNRKGWFQSIEICENSGLSKKKVSICLDGLLFKRKIKKVKVSNKVRGKYNIPPNIHQNCMIYINYD